MGSDASLPPAHFLYAVSVGCPACDRVSQFVAVRDEQVGVMQDVEIDETHCPQCGIQVSSVGGWDLQAEHEIEAVETVGDKV
jgi:hypothetical protein